MTDPQIKPIVIRSIRRLPNELLESFNTLPVANIADAMGKPSFWTINPQIKPAFDNIKLVGSAITVKEIPTSNLMTHVAIDLARPGDVIVVDVRGFTDVAVGGFLMARKLISKGINGVVVDGAWRDRSEIRNAKFPVFTRAWQPTGPHKDIPGWVNIPITCGGVVVKPGDVIVGDDDGVIVIPQESVEDILKSAIEIYENEERIIHETKKELIEQPNPLATEERLRKLGVEFR